MPGSDNPRPATRLSSQDIDFLESLGKTRGFNREFVPREESGVRTPCENGTFPIIGMALDTGYEMLNDGDTVTREELMAEAADIFGEPCSGDKCPQERMDTLLTEGSVAEDDIELCFHKELSDFNNCSNCPVSKTCKNGKTH